MLRRWGWIVSDDFDRDLKELAEKKAASDYAAALKEEQAEDLESKVGEFVSYWKDRLGLWSWELGVFVENEDVSEFDGVPAYVDCLMWEYLKASLHFNGDLLRAAPDEYVKQIVLHEMLHILLAEMECEMPKHEERVVTLPERVLMGEDE